MKDAKLFFYRSSFATKRHEEVLATKKHKSHKMSHEFTGLTSFFFICAFCAFLWLIFSAGSETHDGLFAELRALENSGEPSFVHHGDAVANAEHLFHLTTDHDH